MDFRKKSFGEYRLNFFPNYSTDYTSIHIGLGALLTVVLGLIYWKLTWIKGKCHGLGEKVTRNRTIDTRNVSVVINQKKDDGANDGEHNNA